MHFGVIVDPRTSEPLSRITQQATSASRPSPAPPFHAQRATLPISLRRSARTLPRKLLRLSRSRKDCNWVHHLAQGDTTGRTADRTGIALLDNFRVST